MVKEMEKVDVVIVGSGWSGGITAAELTKKGYKVVCLERGHSQTHEDFIGAKDELRYSIRLEMMQDLSKETITSRSNINEKARPVRNNESARLGNSSGGAGVHWNGVCYRWLPYDFEIYSKTVERYGEDKIPKGCTIQDWGITYDELEPYYDKFEKTIGLSGEINPLGPPRSEYPTPPMKDTPSINLYKKATKSLGYHPYHFASANITERYENPDGEVINACMYCAFCEEHGCDFGAKADPLNTVLKTADKTGNFELRNGAVVTEVLHEGDKASGVKYTDTVTGEEHNQPADLVVLAGFVFTNTKLLLTSGIGKPYDPQTEQGVIGKNFTGHFNNLSDWIEVRGFFNDKKFNLAMGAGALGATIDDFSGDNFDHSDVDFLHGYEIQYYQTGLRPIANNNIPKGTPRWGKEFKEKSLFYTNRNITLRPQTSFLPNRYTYLDLDPNYTDDLGNPLLRVTVTYTEQDIKRTRQALQTAKKIMEEMGADIIDVDEIPDDAVFDHQFFTDHFIGGVIMGDDSDKSAVNTYSQMWDMTNLFVVGGSSFPHMGVYNPTELIGAFAYRAAEGMIKYLEYEGGLVEESKEKREV